MKVWLLTQDRDYDGDEHVLRVYADEKSAKQALALLLDAEAGGKIEVKEMETEG